MTYFSGNVSKLLIFVLQFLVQMISEETGVIPLLISVGDFAFRGRAVSLLGVACGVSPAPLFPQESTSPTPIKSWSVVEINNHTSRKNRNNLHPLKRVPA
jgi:hypothetical protein